MTKYITLLRGINVGGNKKVPMAKLKQMLEKMGFTKVKTLLASGNVVFEAAETDAGALARKIGQTFEATFGFTSFIILRTTAEIAALIESDPFKGITVTPATRLYVTFLTEKPLSKLRIPYVSPEGNCSIIRVSPSEVCSVLTVTDGTRSVDAMAILEKTFGKNVTTRNWNTVLKLVG